MAEHSHGLRNRLRPRGRSTYARKHKAQDADRYGRWNNGTRTADEKIRTDRRAVDTVIIEELISPATVAIVTVILNARKVA